MDAAVHSDVSSLAALHLWGPFVSPQKQNGALNEAWVKPFTREAFYELVCGFEDKIKIFVWS